MRRDLKALAEREFDLVVVGGGIFGACAAWDAAQRGLAVVLIERADFCAATSANSFKMIHGGIRYIQHLDLARVRLSSKERRAFLRVAPHLVRPLLIAVPTYGRWMKGRTALRVGMGLYDLLNLDRNRGLEDPARRVPSCRMLPRSEALELFPELEDSAATGTAVFCDAQMYNPPRLVLAFVRSAVEAGAAAANYVEARGLLRVGDRVGGVEVCDLVSGMELTVRAKVVLDATGPYAGSVLNRDLKDRLPKVPFSRDVCFVVSRQITPSNIGLAVQGATMDPDAILSRGERHLFVVPWRSRSLVGVWHKVYLGHPDHFTVSEKELDEFLAEINKAAPWLELDRSQVSMVNAGLVPFGENLPQATHLRYGHRSQLIDHARGDGIEGLITLIGVRFTTGRYDASLAVNLVFRKLGYQPPPCRTGNTPVWGGQIDDLEQCVQSAAASLPDHLGIEVVRALVHNYGSAYGEIREYLPGSPELAETIGATTTLKAEVIHAVRKEMAQKLTDVVFRRTDLATAGIPPGDEVSIAASLMAAETGWSQTRLLAEIEEVDRSSTLGRPEA